MKPDYKLVAKARYIHMTADLAAEVWGECYKKFYPPKTLAALIDRLQSADAIEADMDGGANYFIVQLGGKPIGYCTSTCCQRTGAARSGGTSWPPASGWPAATARAGSAPRYTPKPCRCWPFLRSGATAPARRCRPMPAAS